MLDILGNIDTVNYFIQDAVYRCLSRPLEVRSNFTQGDGYLVDINETKKNQFSIMICDSSNRMMISRIVCNKDAIVLRYNPKFMITYDSKSKKFSTNLFEESFTLEEIESTFFMQSTIFQFQDIVFNEEIMKETLQYLQGLHNGIIQFIEGRNASHPT